MRRHWQTKRMLLLALVFVSCRHLPGYVEIEKIDRIKVDYVGSTYDKYFLYSATCRCEVSVGKPIPRSDFEPKTRPAVVRIWWCVNADGEYVHLANRRQVYDMLPPSMRTAPLEDTWY